MYGRELRWKGPPATRAKPILPEKWEEHREEIHQLYQHMTLEDVIVIMKIRHRFTPSRRQLVSQLQRWGFYKHSTKLENENIIELNRKNNAEDNMKIDTKAKNVPTSHLSDETLGTRHSLPSRETQALCPPLRYPTATSTDPYYDVVAPAPAYPTSKIGEVPIVFQDSRAVGISKARTEDDALDNSFEESDHANTDIELTSAGPDQDIPADFLPQEAWINLDRPIDSFGPEDIKAMKDAADFLFASQCREDSFTLYVLLLQKLKGSPNGHEWMTISTVIACARSSVTSSQAEIARNLLEQRLSDLSARTQDVAETFLYRSLLADICCRQGDHDARQFHHHLAKHSNFTQERSLKILPRDSRVLDLVTYHYLTQALKCQGQFIASRSVTKQLLCQVPGPFELIEGHMRISCTRSCLQWCIDQWVEDRFMYGSWQNMSSRGENMRRLEALGTFSELWQRRQRQQPKDARQMQSPIWAYQVERSMGISPSEILAVTCVMMLDASPAVEAVFHFHRSLLAFDAPRRALRGGRILFKNSDSELAHAFLGAYLWLNSPSDESSPSDASHALLVRDYTRAFLQDSMKVQLPEVQHSQAIDLSQAIIDFKAMKPPFTSPCGSSVLPTIASSLHSSDFNSLRDFKERIQDHFDNVTQSSYAQLPSSAMRDASRSSLSLLSIVMRDASRSSLSVELPKSICGMSQAVEDTITAASKHVSERIAAI